MKNCDGCYSILFHKIHRITGNVKPINATEAVGKAFSTIQRRLHLRSFLTVFVAK